MIVDAAAEEDLLKYTQLGADLVIFQAQKQSKDLALVWSLEKSLCVVGTYAIKGDRAFDENREKKTSLVLLKTVEDYLQNGSESGESMKNDCNHL